MINSIAGMLIGITTIWCLYEILDDDVSLSNIGIISRILSIILLILSYIKFIENNISESLLFSLIQLLIMYKSSIYISEYNNEEDVIYCNIIILFVLFYSVIVAFKGAFS